MYYISKIKNLATCFSYNDPSSGQQQNKVLVHSVIVHSMGFYIVYNIKYIITHMLPYWLMC